MRIFLRSLDFGKNTSLLSFLAGLCFFLSAIELLIPKPLPFFRLGLVNLAIILAINILPMSLFLVLLFIKVLGQGLISGTLFSYVFLFSLAGTFSSGLLMYFLNFLPKKMISYIGISCAGASLSGAVQLLLAYLFVFGNGTVYFAPMFLLLGLITSVFLGAFVNRFVIKSVWYKSVLESKFDFSVVNNSQNLLNDKNLRNGFYNSGYFRIIVGLCFIISLFVIDIFKIKILLFFITLVLCLIEKIKLRFLNMMIFAFFIVLFNLFNVNGKIIFEFLSFKLTSIALQTGVEKFLIFETLIFTSKWMLNCKMSLMKKTGKIATLINNAFSVFRAFSNAKEKSEKINKANIIQSLDKILLDSTLGYV